MLRLWWKLLSSWMVCNYDEEKQKVNERAKRQIIRKATKFLIDNEIKSETFLKLQNTTEETLKLAKNKLN